MKTYYVEVSVGGCCEISANDEESAIERVKQIVLDEAGWYVYIEEIEE